MPREHLGEVTAPSGALVVVDMGMLGLWTHDRPPLLPEWAAPAETRAIANAGRDHRVEGPDADRAAALFGHQPPYIYDRPPGFERAFAEKVAQARFTASLEPLVDRVPHLARLERALASERRAGVVEFHGVWAVAAGGLPSEGGLEVTGTRMGTGDYPTSWRHVEVHVRSDLPVRATEVIGEVLVDKARLAILDPRALGAWEHARSLDGRADFVFWGRDAAVVAGETGAPALGDGQFGWQDLSIAKAVEHGTGVEKLRTPGRRFSADFRPHSHHHSMLEKIRRSATESGELEVGGARTFGFMTTWGDGAFPIERDLGPDGETVTLRVVLGADD